MIVVTRKEKENENNPKLPGMKFLPLVLQIIQRSIKVSVFADIECMQEY